jgi:hypothetical protein
MFSTNDSKRSLKIIDLFEIVNEAYHDEHESYYNTLHYVLDSGITDIHELETHMEEFKAMCDYALDEKATHNHLTNLETILTLPAVVDYLGGKHVMDLCHLIWEASGYYEYSDKPSSEDYEGTPTYNNSSSDDDEYIESETSDEEEQSHGNHTLAYRHNPNIDDLEDDDGEDVVACKLVHRGRGRQADEKGRDGGSGDHGDNEDDEDGFTVECLQKHQKVLHSTFRWLEFVFAVLFAVFIYSVLIQCYPLDDGKSVDNSSLPFTPVIEYLSDHPQGTEY